jgi:ankyrin repeat protein
VERGDPGLVQFFITLGAELEAVDKEGRTPLVISTTKRDPATARVLVKAGADIHHAMLQDASPAIFAVGLGGDFLTALTTEKSIHSVDENGNNILDLAFRASDSKVAMRSAEQLVLAGAVSQSPIYSYFAPAARYANYSLRFTGGMTPLHFASASGYVGLMRFLIEDKNVDVNEKNASGMTPLHAATQSGNITGIRLLLDNGANINAQDGKGNSVLHIAIPKETNRAVLRLFISRGANLNLRDDHGDSPLHVALRLNRPPEIIGDILEGKADVSVRDIDGKTPLYVAVEENRFQAIPLLLEYKSDIFARDRTLTPFEKALEDKSESLSALITKETVLQSDKDGNTVLHITIKNQGSIETVQSILDKSAVINARNTAGNTALHLAVQQNEEALGGLLLERGADIFATNSAGESPLLLALTGTIREWMLTEKALKARDGLGNTALHYAVSWKMDTHIPLIIEKGADPNAMNATGETPVFIAVQKDGASTLRVLKTAGASLLMRDKAGNSALHAAVRWNAKNAAEELLVQGADINARSSNGKTPLHEAVRLGIADVEAVLLRHNPELEVRDTGGNTPLMEAVMAGFLGATERLAAKGADVSARNSNGATPLHIAVSLEREDITAFLLEKGASVNAKDNQGDTPIRLAIRRTPKMIPLIITKAQITRADDDGLIPLAVAVQERSPIESIQNLVTMDKRQLAIVDAKGRTPLRIAVDENYWDAAKFLLESGADVFSQAMDLKTPVGIVFSLYKAGKAEPLGVLFNGPAINVQDMQGNTILHYAASEGNTGLIQKLLELGADKKAQNLAGETPADVAVRWKQTSSVALLR